MKYILSLSLLLIVVSCSSDVEAVMPQSDQDKIAEFLPRLNQVALPLDAAPLLWNDTSLGFLDEYGDKKFLGLGEATHGTAEFFDAKFRILQYMVVHHGYKGIAMEADFGESVYLNALLQSGEVDKVAEVMKSKMLFWTWSNEETRRMIEWMVEYNKEKSSEDRIHYVGVDCQSNSHHIDLLLTYLNLHTPELGTNSSNQLYQIKSISTENESIEEEDLAFHLTFLEELEEEMDSLSDVFPFARDYEFHLKLIEVIGQVLQVNYSYDSNNNTENLRDKFMAQNLEWYYNYLGQSSLVLWAHNFHVANDNSYRSMGRDLRSRHGSNYGIIGFSFSQGRFRAIHKVGATYLGLKALTIDQEPLIASLNGKLFHADLDNFVVDLSDLESDTKWNLFFEDSFSMLSIGSVYRDSPSKHYQSIDNEDFDKIIYINQTQAATEIID